MNKNILLSKFFAIVAFVLLVYNFTIPSVFFHNLQDSVKSGQKEFSTLTHSIWDFYAKDRYINLSVVSDTQYPLEKMIEERHEIGASSLPVWRFSLFAPNYPKEAFPDGLPVFIHLDGLSGEVHEMDIINHYIGMKPMEEGAKLERQVVPYVLIILSLFVLLFIFVENKVINWLISIAIVTPFAFVGVYAFWLYKFGHDLVNGAITIKPFMPVLLGTGKVAQFSTVSSPESGFWMLVLIAIFSALALLFKRKYETFEESKTSQYLAYISVAFALFAIVYLSQINQVTQETKIEDKEQLILEKQEQERARVEEEKKVQKEQEESLKHEIKAIEQSVPTSALVKVSAMYKIRCASCHGAKGDGAIGPRIIGVEEDKFYKSLEDELHSEIVNDISSDEVKELFEEITNF